MREVIQLIQDLIRFQTVHSNLAQIHACADFIEGYLQQAAIDYKREQRGDYPYLLALPDDDYAPVLLMSHIDVVDGDPELFEPRIEGNRLYGRGSIDDKYAVALSLVLLKQFVEQNRREGQRPAKVPFGILITSDEEIGGKQGALEALKTLRTDFCITLDGGNLQKIVVKEKGILHLRLIAKGTAAHAARPWRGDNAIDNLIQDYLKLRPHFELTAPGQWHRTMNFSRFQAGRSTNQVPDRAEAVFDIRYTEHDDPDALIDQLQASIEGQLVVEKKEPLFLAGQSPYLDLLLQTCPETSTGSEHGASDARHLSKFGIPGIVWGAEGEMSQHTTAEHLLIDSVEALYHKLSDFMTRVRDTLSAK